MFRLPFFVSSLFVCGLAVACSAADVDPAAPAAQSADLVSDISSMMQRPDGLFDVICKNGQREIVSQADILANRVCGSSGEPPHPPAPAGEQIVLYAGEDCTGATRIGVVDANTDCSWFRSEPRRVHSSWFQGQCGSTGWNSAEYMCELYKPEPGRPRSSIRFFKDDFCMGEVVARIGPDEVCASLPSDGLVQSLSSNRGCLSMFQDNAQNRCFMFRVDEYSRPRW